MLAHWCRRLAFWLVNYEGGMDWISIDELLKGKGILWKSPSTDHNPSVGPQNKPGIYHCRISLLLCAHYGRIEKLEATVEMYYHNVAIKDIP
jgi:hypothetical protein